MNDDELIKKTARHITATWMLILSVGFAAFVFRAQDLNLKPLHTDEAVQALKFGDLLEHNFYEYDPVEYHGPTLYYFTLPVAWMQGLKSLADCNIEHLRLIPLIAGVGLIFLLLFIRNGLGEMESVIAAIFLSVSPIFFYYSRYYVQEMWLPFLVFAFICFGYHFLRSGNIWWAILTGLCLGLMHATKETFIISCGCLGLALIIDALCTGQIKDDLKAICWRFVPVIAIVALITSVVFFSSFFNNWEGPRDSILTYGNYFGKGTAGHTGHEKPWFYYLQLLGWNKVSKNLVWTEGMLLVLAAIGIIFALTGRVRGGRRLWRVMAIYSLLLLTIYSALAYKTPWLALNFMHPLILLAALGACGLLRLMPKAILMVVLLAGIGYGVYNLGVQCHLSNWRFHSHDRNPYAYTQTSTDLIRLVNRIKELRTIHPDDKNMVIKIMGTEYWPLPWYLRDMPNVGYWRDGLPETNFDAPILIASAELQETLDEKIGGDYTFDFGGLRPGVNLVVYIQQSLWDEYMKTRK